MKILLLNAGSSSLKAALMDANGTAFAQDVRYNFDKGANFSSFKTYKWVVIKGAQRGTEFVMSMTRESGAIFAMTPWQMPTNASLCP